MGVLSIQLRCRLEVHVQGMGEAGTRSLGGHVLRLKVKIFFQIVYFIKEKENITW